MPVAYSGLFCADFFRVETFARKMILLSGKAKTHGKREFIGIND
ncbi:MAG: hypothetical protein ACJATV_000473 [Granulosicoccus sp.]|jgi:hypothetical protein